LKGKQKYRFSTLIAALLLLPVVLASSSAALTDEFVTSNMVPIWVDNFNVGLHDWATYGFNASADPIVSTTGNFSTVDDTLRAYDDEWNVAQHNSTVAFGTWRFAIDLVKTPRNHTVVAFISGWEDIPPPGQEITIDPSYSYGMIFVTGKFGNQNTSFVLYRRSAGQLSVQPIATYDPDDDPESDGWYEGWYEIAITRNTRYEFDVYINDFSSPKMEVTDTSYTTSEVFYIHAEAGIALDNVSVNNEVTIDYDPPEFTECEDQVYAEGESISYQMEAWDASGILGWVINDTSTFQITSTGLLTNKTILPVGTYGLNVTVSDYGYSGFNYNSKAILIKIEAVTTTSTTTTTTTGSGTSSQSIGNTAILLLAGGGIAIVVILVVLIKLKK